MMTAEYIEEQLTSIHRDNRNKGFWDTPQPLIINRGLIASEMFEAFEGVRKGKYAEPNLVISARKALEIANEILAAGQDEKGSYAYWIDQFRAAYENNIKDTVEAELAGTCIRCFDTLGGRIYEGGGSAWDMGGNNTTVYDARGIAVYAEQVIEQALIGAYCVVIPGQTLADYAQKLAEYIIKMIPNALGIQTGGEELGYLTELASVVDTLKNISLLSTWFGIDLKTHIALEVAYNRTRPMRHGGKAF